MNIVSTIVTAITEIVTGSASAIGDGVVALVLEEGTDGVMQLSQTGIVLFTLFGIGAGFGLMWIIIGLVVRK